MKARLEVGLESVTKRYMNEFLNPRYLTDCFLFIKESTEFGFNNSPNSLKNSLIPIKYLIHTY